MLGLSFFYLRGDGLVWAIKRLIELNSNIEYSHFPRFLDNSHIDYLLLVFYFIIKLGEKQAKCNQLKIGLRTYKERQKKQRETENTKEITTGGFTKNSFNLKTKNSSFVFSNDSEVTSQMFNSTVLSNKTMMEFER